MPELGERFASLARTHAPDLWREIEAREPRNPIEPSSRAAVVAAVVALVVGFAGIGIAAVTFGEPNDRLHPAPRGRSRSRMDRIFFRVGRRRWRQSHRDRSEPDGSGRRVVFPKRRQHPLRPDLVLGLDGSRIAFDNYLVDEYGI